MNTKTGVLSVNRRRYLQVAAASSLLPLAYQASARTSTQRQQVTISISLEPDGLDPTISHAASVGQVVHYNVLEGLVKIDEAGQPQPLLAQQWRVSHDRLRYTFDVHPQARFHDGSALTAETVRYSFSRAQQLGKKNKAHETLFGNIAAMQVLSTHTLQIDLHRPDPHLLFRLGESTAVILHPATADHTAQHPIGTGPYQFVHWQRGHSVRMRRFDDYHTPKPHLVADATVRFMPVIDEQAIGMERGEIDVSFNFITHDLHRFQSDPRYQVLMGATSGKGMLAINHRIPALADVRVRQAMAHAIDKQAFIDRVMKGRSTAIGSHFAPADPGYLNLTSTAPYNPAYARRLLQDAGIQLPLTLTLTALPVPYALEGAPVIAEYLADIGIHVKVVPVTWAQWLNETFQGQFELSLITHVEPLDHLIYQDPDYYFGYDSAAYRQLIARYHASDNARERQQLFADVQRHLAADAVNVWLFSPQMCTVARKGLQGLRTNHPILVHDISAMHWL